MPATNSSALSHIPVVKATCTGGTALAAFHEALLTVNLGHYNLIRLSSVIPPGVTVGTAVGGARPGGDWGDRLYCVWAEQRTSTPGEEAWAGIGWVQRVDGRGGLFVEHEGGSEGFVTEAIQTSLSDMVANEDAEFTGPQLSITGGHCHGVPVCALVIAPFRVVPWTDPH
jgi:arginine decarboxylase